MKTLIVYYSRTGVTRTVAEALAKQLGADLEEICDQKNRSGVLGFLVAGWDAAMKNLTEISEARYHPGDYQLVIVGTPVWAFTMAPAIRTYLTKHTDSIAKGAFFCTMGGDDVGTFRHMAKVLGKQPVATLGLLEGDVRGGVIAAKVMDFADALTRGG